MKNSKIIGGLKGRSLLRDIDLTKDQFMALLDLAEILRTEKKSDTEKKRLKGKNIAIIFEKSSTRTRSSFEVGGHDQGAHVTYMGPGDTHMGRQETIKDTARVLGRMFDGIEFRGFAHHDVELLAEFSGVPVWNGLTDEWHPTQLLADILTIRDHSSKPLERIALTYVGDARNNTANSLLCVGALLGMDIRIAAPLSLQPNEDVQLIAKRLAQHSDAKLSITENPHDAVAETDFIYTDVWVSMGEPTDSWAERIKLLLPYQVNEQLVHASKNPDVRFLHCLPALHNTDTEIGKELNKKYGVSALEVTEEVFESATSIVFDQAENRLHTIKAVMVATLAGA
jgi:ornithine carbamoyltransferase